MTMWQSVLHRGAVKHPFGSDLRSLTGGMPSAHPSFTREPIVQSNPSATAASCTLMASTAWFGQRFQTKHCATNEKMENTRGLRI
jgi:hypothetical protein